MADAVVSYNPQAWAEALRDRIKAAMMDMIPNEVLEGLIKTEISSFLETKTKTSGYGYNQTVQTAPSELSVLVHKRLEEEVKETWREMRASAEYGGFWGNQREEMGKEMVRIIAEKTPEVMGVMMRSMMESFVREFMMRSP